MAVICPGGRWVNGEVNEEVFGNPYPGGLTSINM